MLQDRQLIHARRYCRVQYKTVLLPVVVEIIFTQPVDRLLNAIAVIFVLSADLETLAISHTHMENSLTDKLITNFSESISVVVVSIDSLVNQTCHVVLKVLEVAHHGIGLGASMRVIGVQKTDRLCGS